MFFGRQLLERGSLARMYAASCKRKGYAESIEVRCIPAYAESLCTEMVSLRIWSRLALVLVRALYEHTQRAHRLLWRVLKKQGDKEAKHKTEGRNYACIPGNANSIWHIFTPSVYIQLQQSTAERRNQQLRAHSSASHLDTTVEHIRGSVADSSGDACTELGSDMQGACGGIPGPLSLLARPSRLAVLPVATAGRQEYEQEHDREIDIPSTLYTLTAAELQKGHARKRKALGGALVKLLCIFAMPKGATTTVASREEAIAHHAYYPDVHAASMDALSLEQARGGSIDLFDSIQPELHLLLESPLLESEHSADLSALVPDNGSILCAFISLLWGITEGRARAVQNEAYGRIWVTRG